MLSWLKKNRLVKFGVWLVIFTVVLVAFLGWKVDQMSRLISEKKAILEESDQIQADFEDKLKQYQILKERGADNVFEIRQSRAKIIDILDDFEKLGKKYNLEVKINSAENTSPNNLGYALSFQGNFDQAVSYVRELQGLPYYLRINSLMVKGVTVDLEKKTFDRPTVDKKANIKLNLTVYLQ